MNDPDKFLQRWSRRKRDAGAENTEPEESRAKSGHQAVLPDGQISQPAAKEKKEEAAQPPAFDVTSLPSIESINAGTDLSVFMQTGVPPALRHAALRRAWTADPAIRDFMGPTENYWDAAGPDGIPGFGALDPGLDVKRMVAELFGETAPDKPEPEQPASAAAPAQSGEVLETAKDDSKMTAVAPQQSAPEQIDNGAAQKEGVRKKVAQEGPMQKMTCRHGGAMPE